MLPPNLNIAQIKPHRSRRSSSYDRSGGNLDFVTVAPHQTHALLDTPGPATITHIWITILHKDPNYRKNLILRAYWDNQENPSIEAPIGDFFGQGWGQEYDFSSPYLAAAPRDGKALVCYFPMPFAQHGKITIENQSDQEIERLYYYVDYEELPSFPADTGYFHAWYNQERTSPETSDQRENEWSVLTDYENNPSDQNNYLWLQTQGAGHFVGINYYVNNPGPMWYGEGDDMFLIDGEPWPGLHGTGTEDYFNTSWSPDTLFQHPFFGTAYAPGRNNNDPLLGWIGRTHVYRFHPLDPIRFQTSLRASIEHGHANCLALDLSSVAYWYQTLPTPQFPPLPSPKERIPLPAPTVSDIHRWRQAYLDQHPNARPWGTHPNNP